MQTLGFAHFLQQTDSLGKAIFAPLLIHAVKIDLPRVASSPNQTRPDNVQLAIRADGDVYWNGEPVDRQVLAQRMAAAAKFDLQPEVHLRADRATEYQHVAEVMSAAARAGLTKIGFVTEPGGAQ